MHFPIDVRVELTSDLCERICADALLVGGADARDATCFVPRNYVHPAVPLAPVASSESGRQQSPAPKRLRIALPRVCSTDEWVLVFAFAFSIYA